jgi:hypothetical protein
VAISFLALYRGPNIDRARLIAITVDSELIQEFARRLLLSSEPPEHDSALKALQDGRWQALRIVGGEAADE